MKAKLIIVALFAIAFSVTSQTPRSFVSVICSDLQRDNASFIKESDNEYPDGHYIKLNVNYHSFVQASRVITNLLSKYSDVYITDKWYTHDGTPTLICRIRDTNLYVFFHYIRSDGGDNKLLVTVSDLTSKINEQE